MAAGIGGEAGGPAESSQAFLEAEAAALSLLEAAEKQQDVARDLQLTVQTATRQLALQQTELAKVAMAVEQGHQGHQQAINQAIARFQQSIGEADQTVSGYVVAALERHQTVFSTALQDAAERSIERVQQVTEVAGRETLESLRQAAVAGQSYAESARQGVKAFRNRQWSMLFAAFAGGLLAAMAGAITILVLLDDGGRVARLNQLEGRIQVLQRQHNELQQEIDAARRSAGSRPAPRPAR
jgi:hypothetical protein